MKQKENKSTELVKVSKTGLVAMVTSQIKGKDLFPKKTEAAKKMLSRARYVKK